MRVLPTAHNPGASSKLLRHGCCCVGMGISSAAGVGNLSLHHPEQTCHRKCSLTLSGASPCEKEEERERESEKERQCGRRKEQNKKKERRSTWE